MQGIETLHLVYLAGLHKILAQGRHTQVDEGVFERLTAKSALWLMTVSVVHIPKSIQYFMHVQHTEPVFVLLDLF